MPQRYSSQANDTFCQGYRNPSVKSDSASERSDTTNTFYSTTESVYTQCTIPSPPHPALNGTNEETSGQQTWNTAAQYFPEYGSYDETYYDTLLDGEDNHHALRLFSTMKGYHKGSLDLIGRHPNRYYPLQACWNSFLCEFKTTGANELDWLRFQERWGLAGMMDYNDTREASQEVLAVLKQRPEPMFQGLFLVDLPPELLSLTFHFISTSDAVALSCTCRLLNSVGRRHIFRHRKLRLQLSSDIQINNVEYSDIDLPAVAQYAKKDFLKDVYFLLGCPPVRAQIRSLLITDEWWPRGRVLVPQNGNHRNPFLLDEEFYRPIYEHTLIALQCIPRLTELTLRNLDISRELLVAISAAPSLNTLSLEYCRVPTIVQACILLNRLPASSSLANLNILIDPDAEETHTQWYTLILFPRIRTLSIGGVGQTGFPLPDSTIQRRCHLPNLERLALQDLDAGDIDSLSSWLHTIGCASGLRLTHFKLHSSWGILDADVMGLLRCLEAAPLEVLVLEGLANADLALFDCISAHFPRLVALTLVRRQNSYQFENRVVAWPHASWEYAQHMKGFRRLRHFCWNFSTAHYDATPAPLLALESNFTSAGNDGVEEEPIYFMDSHFSALPFAAYCPALQTYAIMDRAIDMACHITRNPFTGAITLKAALPAYTSTFAWNIEQWNTIDCKWPSLPPLEPTDIVQRIV